LSDKGQIQWIQESGGIRNNFDSYYAKS
jgi:hypothetical protein